MSPCRDTGGRREDEGFSLIEIIVALGIISLMVVSLLPQLVVGIKATRTSQLVTQVKALTQGELEAMRNLPYRVAPDASPYVDLDLDVLDRYYPTKDPAETPMCSEAGALRIPGAAEAAIWTGFVDNDSASDRCEYEPQDGAFYRTVELRSDPEIGDIALVTDTQFLSIRSDTQAVEVTEPRRSTYNTNVGGQDSPPSPQIGVTLTVLYDEAGKTRTATTYTQIAQEIASPERIHAAADAVAVEIESTDEVGASLETKAGVVTLRASLTHASTVSADLAALTARRSSADEADAGSVAAGAAETYFAPPNQSVTPVPANAACDDHSCWGDSALGPTPLTLNTDNATPRAGSSSAPLTAVINGPVGDVAGQPGLRFDNTLAGGSPRYVGSVRAPLVALSSSMTGLLGCVQGATGYAASTGYIESTAAGASSTDTVTACAQASTGAVSLIPLDGVAGGLITVTLKSAWARCQRGGLATDYGYEAIVSVAGSTAGPWTISKATAATLPAPADVTLDSGGTLADYVSSWSGLLPSGVVPSDVDGETSVSVPGVVTIVTKHLRRTDPDATDPPPSDVKVTVGQASCSAKDSR